VRIAQSDFEFPAKKVIPGAFEVRVTQRGFDRITERVRELVLAFFGADANGRAVIPLSALGLGSIGTGLGPLDASVRDLVLTLDLSTLRVTLTPGSSPARLSVSIRGADVGLVDGSVVGSASGFLFSGDVACRLANGANDRVALVDLDLAMTLRLLDNGTVDLRVLPSTFDIQQFGLTVQTDCNLPQCLDGLSPGSTSECNECTTLCPTGDFLATLVTSLRDAFDDAFDRILSGLGDEVANLVLGLFVNNRPLAVEGLLPLANVLGPVLDWMRSARPLAVFAKPAANGVRVSGAGDSLGLDLVFDAGFDANTHPCIGATGPDPEYRPGPRPGFDGVAITSDGTAVPYDLAFGVSDAIVNAAIHAAWKSGALCILATSDDLARLSQGGLVVGATTLDLLLPGYASLTGGQAPIRVAVSPRLDSGTNPVRFGQRDAIEVAFVAASIGVDAWLGDAWVRVLTLSADLALGVEVAPTDDARLELRLGALALDNLVAADNVLFADARLDVIAPFVVDVALSFLAERPISFDLGTSGLLEGLGVSLAPVVVAIGPAGPLSDWLGVYLTLEPIGQVGAGLQVSDPSVPAFLAELRGQGAETHAVVSLPGDAATVWRLRLGGGLWSAPFVGPGPHRFEHPRFVVGGVQTIEARADDGTVMHVDVQRTLDVPVASAQGCQASRDGSGGWWGVMVLLLWAVARRLRGKVAFARRAARVVVSATVAAGLSGGCSGRDEAPPRVCQAHDQCDDGFYCAASGRCEPASVCDGDEACCPGSVCFSGWCRPTEGCSDARPCAGFDAVCEQGQCVPARCDTDAACRPGARCVAGRCLVGEPCGGTCGPESVCDVASGLCLDGAHCGGLACEDGWRVTDWGGTTPDPMLCAGRSACICAPEVAPEPALAGIDPILATTLFGPVVLSYDERHGDLVATREDGTTNILDGDARAGGAAIDGDVGRGLALAPASDAGGAVDIWYQDRPSRELVHGVVAMEPNATPRLLRRTVLPIAGDAGRFQCLVRVPTDAGPRLRGWAFVAADPTDTVSRLVRLEALADPPEDAGAWRVTTVVETPLPPRSSRPCAGACPFASVCVLESGAERCAAPALIAPPACDVCGPREVCASLRDGDAAGDDAEARCFTRVEPDQRLSDGRSTRGDAAGAMPWGEGHFVTCAVDINAPGGAEVVVAWRDADRRRVVIATERANGVPIGQTDLTIGEGADPGHHLDLAIAPSGSRFLAFQDAAGERLVVAETTNRNSAWQWRAIEPGGAWARAVVAASGAIAVVHGDGRAGTLRVAARGVGGGACWASQVLAPAVAVFAAASDAGGGSLTTAWRQLAFDGPAVPTHRLVIDTAPLPRCDP
jgi:hypothetical protein